MTTRTALAAVLSALPAVALTAVVGITGFTHDAPIGGFAPVTGVDAVVYEDIAASKPHNVPTFATHGERGCEPLVEGELVDTVLVVTQDGDTRRMAFDAAWDRAHNDTWVDDVWTIGAC